MSRILNELVISNKKLTGNLYKMTLKSSHITKNAKPGTFINLECGVGINTILRRPISICNVEKQKGQFDIAYRVVGIGTEHLKNIKKGDTVNFIGPLGKEFPIKDNGRVLIIGGGIGVFPLYYLLKNIKTKVDVILGFRNKAEVVMEKEFEKSSNSLKIVTDDGSYGNKGYVTDDLVEILNKNEYTTIYACGPEPMLCKVKSICEEKKIETFLSLEQRMGCGIGACLVCSVMIKDGDGYKYGRVCKDGPVFKSTDVILNS